MTTVTTTVAVSVVGDAGRLDVAVSPWTGIAQLAQQYVEAFGGGPVVLHTTDGRVADVGGSVRGAGVHGGAILVAVPVAGGQPSPGRHRADVAVEDAVARPREPRLLAAPAVAAAGVVVGVAGLAQGDRLAWWPATALLVLATLTIGLAIRWNSVGLDRTGTGWLGTVPLQVGVAAGLVAAAQSQDVLLVAAISAMGAASGAAVLRTVVPGAADDVMLGWMVTGVVVSLVTGGCLLVGWAPGTAWSVLAAAGVLTGRAVPGRVIRVPDHVLVDLDRLAVTAWAARERPRRSFRGVIRQGDVATIARRGSALVTVGTVGSLLVAICGVVGLVTSDVSGLRRVGAVMLCLSAGTVLVLAARSRRDLVGRRLQRVTGAAILVGTSAWWLASVGEQWQTRLGIAAVGAGVVTVVAAGAVGRGWSSVWWSRRAEQAETVAGVVLIATLPLATGLFDAVRSLTSG